MNPISETIIQKCHSDILMRTLYYNTLGVPGFVQIECGLYRLIVSPMLPINDETKFCWAAAGEVFFPPVEIPKEFEHTYLAQAVHPLNIIRRLPEKSKLYLDAYAAAELGQAVIAIDYEAEEVRAFFDPIVIDVSG